MITTARPARAKPLSPKLLVRRSDHRFFLGMGLFMSVLVFLGFWPTYFQPLATFTYGGNTLRHIHAVVFLSWMGLFLVQNVLVIRRRTPLHKRIGQRGMILGGLMLALGLVLAMGLLQRLLTTGQADSLAQGAYLAAEPFVDIAQFVVLLVLGYLSRRDAGSHKRYMLLATVAIMPPATARMGYLIGPWSMEILFVLFAALLLLHDRRVHGRTFRATVIGLMILLPRALLAMSYKF